MFRRERRENHVGADRLKIGNETGDALGLHAPIEFRIWGRADDRRGLGGRFIYWRSKKASR